MTKARQTYSDTEMFLKAVSEAQKNLDGPVEIVLTEQPQPDGEPSRFGLAAKAKTTQSILVLFEYVGESQYRDIEDMIKLTGQRKAESLARSLVNTVTDNIVRGYRQGYINRPYEAR